MWFNAVLLSSLLAASVVASTIQIRSPSPITLPIAIKINTSGGFSALLERDRARIRALYEHGLAMATGFPVPATNAGVSYTVNVGVGASNHTLLVDTGSSNTWVGANSTYKPGPHSKDTGQTVSVSYGSGNFSGEEYLDDVTIGPATISGQSIGVAKTSSGFDGLDGLLGVGPTDLTKNTTSGGGTFPTVTDNLAAQKLIPSAILGVSFTPTTSTSLHQLSGELQFGGVDESQYTGNIKYVPITSRNRASQFWGIDQSVTYGSSDPGNTVLRTTAGIVDTGTTLVLLATDAFRTYENLTGAKPDKATGLLKLDNPQKLQSLFFHIGENTFEFTPNAQIWPRALNTQIGGQVGATYLIVGDLGTASGQGLDFVNGFTFLQRFYSVYDTEHAQVGIATTKYTKATTN